MIEITADAIIKAPIKHVHVPEERQGYPGTSRRISIMELLFNDLLVNQALDNEGCYYTIRDSDGTEIYSGRASYETVWTDKGVEYPGWTAVIILPALSGYYTIDWELIYAGGRASYTDRVYVKPHPKSDRSVKINADGYI